MIQAFLHHPLHTAAGKGYLDLRIALEKGVLVAITGPSGSGKTTLLRMLAGLLHPREGKIVHDGEIWLDTAAGIRRRPQDRQAGMVFQDYALFPNMTVHENLRFALAKAGSREIVGELVGMFELRELLGRFPRQLSGGQQQRVALARALVRRPSLLLLDEPLSALDPLLRSRLQDYVLEVHQRYGLTTLLVSHDYGEIKKMAGWMIRMDNGRIVEAGSPSELLRPESQGLSVVYHGMDEQGMAIFSREGKFFTLPAAPFGTDRWRTGQEVVIRIEDG
ncbi:MAG: hypothetical protein RL386_1217 [Bacteroidota bacterium]|jgi:molybdate transport system ATP-binding protein